MHKRLKKVLVMLAAVFAAGIIYFIITRFGITIPCVFYEVTGLYCPGCGVTRMCSNFIRLNFYASFRSNPVCFFVFPMLGVIFARRLYLYIRHGNAKNEKWMNVLAITILVILLVFGILRNIPMLYFLRPI